MNINKATATGDTDSLLIGLWIHPTPDGPEIHSNTESSSISFSFHVSSSAESAISSHRLVMLPAREKFLSFISECWMATEFVFALVLKVVGEGRPLDLCA